MDHELDDIEIKERHISELKFTETNPVKRTKRGKDTINRSLNELGAGRSVLTGKNDVLIAGNGTVEQAKELGITRVIEVTVPDRNTLVAVKRPDLSEEEEFRMAMLDNASAKLAVWNPEDLCDIKLKGVSIEGIFTEKEFDKLTLPKKDREQIEPEDLPEGENIPYVIVQCEDRASQEGLYEYLLEEGYEAMKYDGNKRSK